MRRFLRPAFLIPAVIVAGVALVVGLYVFQPWKLFTTTEVNEALPTSAAELDAPASPTPEPASPSTGAETPPAASPAAAASAAAADSTPTVLAEGTFISHEHPTSGTVKILELEDGTRVLRLEDLDTSDGPQLEVWLTDQPVIDGIDGWGVFDDGKHISLGALKGNVGNQNYAIPADVDLADYSSVSIWCARFHVSFGAAELKATS